MDEPDISIDIDIRVQEVILAASQHDLARLRCSLREYTFADVEAADVQDPDTGYTPLHAAIAACEADGEDETHINGEAEVNGVNGANEPGEAVTGARETVKLLLQDGAIWNQLDKNDETPGCLARRLGLTELYELMVDAGVRAELLLNRLEEYEQLSDDEDTGEATEQSDSSAASDGVPTEVSSALEQSDRGTRELATTSTRDVTSSRYLQSDLSISGNRILDNDYNGVMMDWERDIMHASASRLSSEPGARVLNIGHGMGIIDSKFQSQSPSSHHIVEAHPAVLTEMRSKGWFDKPGVVVHEGKWQDVLPKLVEEGLMFDAIYYDTFAETYSDFRNFFSEQLIGLLDPAGKWAFFNGMGADRQISYDVYQKVVEMDLFEAGFEVEWAEIDVPKFEGQWDGVRRPYWVIEKYRMPNCRFMD